MNVETITHQGFKEGENFKMSDYKREKVLRIPFSETGIGNDEAAYDYFCALEEIGNKLVGYSEVGKFQIAPTHKGYVDYVILARYELGSKEFGRVRELRPSEAERFSPVFKSIMPNCNMKAVRLVDFCWYNCSEAPSYYDIEEDEFYDEITDIPRCS